MGQRSHKGTMMSHECELCHEPKEYQLKPRTFLVSRETGETTKRDICRECILWLDRLFRSIWCGEA